jgi:hypothetical protein
VLVAIVLAVYKPRGMTRVGPDRESTTSTPRWVKAFGTIALIVVLLFAILLFTRGPHHGPGDHTAHVTTPVGQAADVMDLPWLLLRRA